MNAGDPWARPQVRLLAAIVVAIAAGILIVVLFISGDDDGGSQSLDAGFTGPVIASKGDISALAQGVGHPVYWAGQREGSEIELTQTSDGRVYVRYLTGGAEAGDPRPIFLTVGTYPFEDPRGALEELAKESDAESHELADGGLAVTTEGAPNSIYIAYPDTPYQVEVFAPDAAEGLSLVTSGAITPVR
jgi:hypothetical protein